ncbi:winged helix DNA-binding domain-containing protein [Microbacterium sp. H1-D42]|uniref:winged helix DNA-binding domain-containing protein n=1 Tax=Microbacterium sp. H1-D42 TaxID=2925844 RepID=UPI001F52F510|nr:winged helix DNA-binding domain-containing protein [Microbacterium sp. H1-D42]UNK69950.1 winged helix DNA-binding domain-containing protein [Microbacterium sp. H1-D42]
MSDLRSHRLRSDRLRSHRLTAPVQTMADAADHLLAVQAQDFLAGRWALGARTRGEVTLSAVDRLFARGRLVRAWTMRGTLHIVPARDLRWVLSVTADRQRQQAAGRHRDLGIDAETMDAARRALRPALADGGCTRAEAFARFESVGIDPSGQRGIHLLFALTVGGEICQGPITGGDGRAREQRFVAVEEWVRESAAPDDPLAELFVRYIDGHGPAGVRDFAWWSGLTLTAAREAAERAQGRVREVDAGTYAARRASRRTLDDSTVFALPAFDEYYISYADRSAVCALQNLDAVGPGKNGMVRPTIIESGQVIGTWAHAAATRGAAPELFDARESTEPLASALARFAHFVEN